MAGPIDNPLDQSASDSTASNEAAFPILLSNPSLLNLVTNAANLLGTTYQQVASAIAAQFKPSSDCSIGTYNAIAAAVNKYGAAQSAEWSSVINGIQQDIVGECNTITSGIQNSLTQCESDIQTTCEGLAQGFYLKVPNIKITCPDNWLYQVSCEEWTAGLPDFYYLNANCQLVSGIHVLSNGNVEVPPNGEQIAPIVWESIKAGGGWQAIIDAFPPPTDNIIEANIPSCNPPPLDVQLKNIYGYGGIIKPQPTPIPPVIKVPNPVQPPPIVAPPIAVVPPPITQPGSNNVCPPPTIIVNVSPTPVNINVQPCSPTVISEPVSTVPSPVTGLVDTGIPDVTPKENLAWEPPEYDYVEQLLNAFGFPRDFVESFGAEGDSEDQVLLNAIKEETSWQDL